MSEKREREKRIEARREQLAARMPKAKTVRVEPTSDDLRKYLKHPKGIKFAASGTTEWPLDRFTKRRIADGSIKVVEDAPKQRQRSEPASG